MGFKDWRGVGRRAISAGMAFMLAATLLVTGLLQAVPNVMADSIGELVVQPAPGKTIADVNRMFGTSLQLQLTDTTQALVRTNTVNATLAAMQADARSARPTVAWAEENARADDPRAQEDSGSAPYCPPPPAEVPTQASAKEDSGSAGPCSKKVLLSGPFFYEGQYAAEKLGLQAAQRIERGDGQVVAVLDTQVDALHPSVLLRTRNGLDLVAKSLLSPLVNNGRVKGHGTFVAGVVLRTAPAAKILPVAVLNEDGRGSTAQVAAGIRWAVKSGATVINMSLTTPTDTRVMREAVEYALSRGVVLVAAYGNEGRQAPTAFPADYPGVISVMAVDKNDRRAAFSNFGRPNLIAAPGVNIVSGTSLLFWAIGSGTSYATPWVAGTAALLRDHHGNATPAQVQDILQRSADDVTGANGGARTIRVNALRALSTPLR